MSRTPRLHAPGALVHVIARFVNREARIAGPAERKAFLERVPIALSRTDWTLHAYALMSTHIHLALTAGDARAARFLKSLFGSYALRLNRMQGRLGALVAERSTTVVMSLGRMAALVAYLHNNPVRAGLVAAAADSDWTSHRAWIGESPAPTWLAVDAGLAAAGFESNAAGRASFDQFVREHAADPRDPVLSGSLWRESRASIRASAALPVELSGTRVHDGGVLTEVLHRGVPVVEPRWNGDLRELIAATAHHAGCAIDRMLSRSRDRTAVGARRIAVVAGVWLLRRPPGSVAAALGVSESAVSQLQLRGETVLSIAKQVADEVRHGWWANDGRRVSGT